MKRSLSLLGSFLILAMTASSVISADTAPRMTKEQLLPLLTNPDVGVVDVRSQADWAESKEKIKGAVRIDPGQDITTIIDQLPAKTTLVFYCS